jgi:hypothetical protein
MPAALSKNGNFGEVPVDILCVYRGKAGMDVGAGME